METFYDGLRVVLALIIGPLVLLSGILAAGYGIGFAWIGVQLVLWALTGREIK